VCVHANSWLEEYWYNSYLKGRDPLPGVVSPFFVLEDDPTPSRSSQSARATSLIVSTLKFFMVWKAGQLTPDVFKHVPLDMSQYNCLFSSTRLPGAREDMPMSFDDSRHIVILCCGQFYWFNVLTPDGKLCLPAVRVTQLHACGIARALTRASFRGARIASLTTSEPSAPTPRRRRHARTRSRRWGYSQPRGGIPGIVRGHDWQAWGRPTRNRFG